MKVKIFIILSLLALSILGFYFFKPKNIQVINPVKTNFTKTLSVTGTIESFNNALISSNLNNLNVKNIFFDKGNFVKKGQTLLLLDNSDLLIDLKKTEISIDQTKANIDKIALNIKGLREKKSINALNDSDLEESKNKIDQAKINFDNAKAQLSNLLIQLNFDKKEYERNKKLFEQNAISQADLTRVKNILDKAQENYQLAEKQIKGYESIYINAKKSYQNRPKYKLDLNSSFNEINLAQSDLKIEKLNLKKNEIDKEQVLLNLSRTNIKSPISGYIIEKSINIGDNIQSGKNLFNIVALDSMYIKSEIDELNLKKIKINQEAVIVADAYPDIQFKSKIYDIIPSVNTEKGTFEVRLKIPATDKKFLPKQNLTINIVLGKINKALKIPKSAMFEQSNKNYVFIENNGLVIKREFELLDADRDFVVIESKINQNNNIVKDSNLVKEGQKIKAIKDASANNEASK